MNEKVINDSKDNLAEGTSLLDSELSINTNQAPRNTSSVSSVSASNITYKYSDILKTANGIMNYINSNHHLPYC